MWRPRGTAHGSSCERGDSAGGCQASTRRGDGFADMEFDSRASPRATPRALPELAYRSTPIEAHHPRHAARAGGHRQVLSLPRAAPRRVQHHHLQNAEGTTLVPRCVTRRCPSRLVIQRGVFPTFKKIVIKKAPGYFVVYVYFNECARVLVIPQRLGGVWPLQTFMIHEH